MGTKLEIAEVMFFAKPAEFRTWLKANHARADELWVGYHKRSTGIPSMTWPESVDQALCYGWIDGIRRTVDADRYANRFTPRRAGSTWSVVNTKRAHELIAIGEMRPAGRAAFEARDPAKTREYSFERDAASFTAEQERAFRADREAWLFFQAQPPSYRKTVTYWVVSARQEATRVKRLATLIADSAAGLRIAQLRREKK